MPQDPVQPLRDDESARPPEAGIGLCLSGGGYRAMLFHVGALWRLYESGLLAQAKRISSVSGGSITAAMLGLKWSALSFDPARKAADFVPSFVDPICKLASETIDAEAVILGIALPGAINGRIEGAYEEHLFGKATLQDLPDTPRFVMNATNVQSGARSGAYWGIRTNIADYQLPNPLPCPFDRTIALADTPTRLKRMDAQLQERLINWGYAVCDAALRKHVDPGLATPNLFPYSASGV